ncbi:hypothetical protein OTU49_017340 [Cherax quadricarinatus]|uniref:Folate receptor-like domain-containing protein n=1 Tax=Cherax quadricarinatus TaxID=27406 RepID=A0AAW0Y3H5_CHEQU
MIHLCISTLILTVVMGQKSTDMDKLLNWCLDAKLHKTAPGPENSLHKQCSPWKDRSCCTEETAHKVHNDNIYNFNYNHCRNMSKKCNEHFLQDHCFYECSPNVGPWVVSETRTWRKERFYKVPLCASDCDAWFNDCAEDFTCTDNWSRNFDWLNDTGCSSKCLTNFCPKGSECMTFRKIYGNASNFCEKVWDHAWQYTKDSEPCMRLWFNGSVGNPNDAVARHHAHLIAGASTKHLDYLLFGFLLMILWRTICVF